MATVQLQTTYSPWRLARSVNQSSSAAVSRLPTLIEPKGDAATATGNCILDLSDPVCGFTQNALLILPFGTGADASTFSVNVYGWAPSVIPNASGQFSWYPTLLCQLTATLSSTNVGPAGGYDPNGATDYFAKTLTVAIGNAGVSVDAVSPATAGLFASATVDLKGFKKVELSFFTGSSATDCNALVRVL